MQPLSNSAPAPGSGSEPQIIPVMPVPGPAVVPPKPPAKRRFILWGIPLIVAILGGGIALYLNTASGQKALGKGAQPAAVVPVASVSLGDLHATVRVSGTVAAQNFAALLAPRIVGSRSGMNRGGTDTNFSLGSVGSGSGGVGGGGPGNDFSLILMKLADPGLHVKTGDVVGQFDPQMQQQRLDDYRDSVIQTQNSVRKMIANLATIREAHDQTALTAKATWDKSVLDMQTAPIRSAIQAEEYKLAMEQNEASYKELLYEASLVIEQQAAQIRVQQLNLDQAAIELKRAEMNVQRMTMKTPMDGIVVMQSIVRNGEFGQIREGDQVFPGQPFMQIVDPSSMVLNATVNQVDAEKLRLGMKSTIRLDAYPDIEMPGTLIGIGALSKTSTFRASYVGEIPIRVKIERIDPRVIPDLTGSAEIELSSEKNTLLAPREAVFEENGSSFVFLQGPEGWIRKPVELGLVNFTTVAIHSGVQKGDVIALQRPM
jgi:multidrug efflux pump subunit AcrA (membrane-fusion protein)